MYHYIRTNEARVQQPITDFSTEEIKQQLESLSGQIKEYVTALHILVMRGKMLSANDSVSERTFLCSYPFIKANKTGNLNKCQYCIVASFGANINMHPCHTETARNLKFSYTEENIERRILELICVRDYWQEILDERKAK